jgi:Na+/H+-translocating membrane pyrophosphatase
MGFSLVVSLLALVMAGYLVRDVWRQDRSTAQRQAIADAIRKGGLNIEERRASLFADGPGESS